jgi:hypothetical protein
MVDAGFIGATIVTYRGICFEEAYRCHQNFKWEVIAQMPREGGVIDTDEVKGWLHANGVKIKL